MFSGLAITGLAGSGAHFISGTSAGATVHVWASALGAMTTTNTASMFYGKTRMLLYGMYAVNASAGAINAGPGGATAGTFLASNSLRFSIPAGFAGWISFGPEGLVYSAADANVGLRIASSTGLYAVLVVKPLE